jgi:hypothetical protein
VKRSSIGVEYHHPMIPSVEDKDPAIGGSGHICRPIERLLKGLGEYQVPIDLQHFSTLTAGNMRVADDLSALRHRDRPVGKLERFGAAGDEG